MSIQSDVEILSIQALEAYAEAHHLSENVAVNLFPPCLKAIKIGMPKVQLRNVKR